MPFYSAESSSEGSLETSDENDNQQASSATKKRNFNQRLADGSPNLFKNIVQGKPVPTTNLNIGMDFWNASAAGAAPMKMRPNASGASPLVVYATVVGREGISITSYIRSNGLTVLRGKARDERELIREKRKQSKRESTSESNDEG
ncbi:G-box-binding factor 1-like [Cornus florida]|uniref:G-box-binding factor 1-like n=1 Tax=Cornus florida TaxID=4283 RepID=UPI0028A12D1B|nr:G-box-binding factor 1-like [Cornus florida]